MTERPPKLTENDIATLAASVRAPESLHQRVKEMVESAEQPTAASLRSGWAIVSRRGTFALAGALTAVVAVALAIALPGGGGSSTLTPRAAAALALAPATKPAPGESARNRGELTASVGGVSFPYWKERFGWRDSGARDDTLDGRAVTTVFYSNAAGQRIGYTIAAGPAPAGAIGSGTTVHHWGVVYQLGTLDGASVIAWRRGGHLCVIAGHGVSHSTLLALAGWSHGRGGRSA